MARRWRKHIQSWPTKRVTVIVPFTAGSATDIMARTVAQRLSEQLGQPFVVENRPGAGGTIGVGAVARAEPDGHTILVHSSSYTITPTTYPNTPYDTVRDLVGITPLALLPNVLVISPDKGIKTVPDLVKAAKAKPGAMNYASAGVGTATQLNAERFRMGAGIEVVHVPFKGTPEALTEIIAGRVDYYFCPVNAVLPLIEGKKLLALAMGSSKRSAALPNVPTTVEAGVANSDYNFWVGMVVPAKTPRDIVNRIHQETAKALESKEVRASMAKLGAESMLMRLDEFDSYIRNEIKTNAALVKRRQAQSRFGSAATAAPQICARRLTCVFQRLAHARHGVGRRLQDLRDERGEVGAGHRIDVDLELLRLGEIGRVLHGGVERRAQRRDAVGRHVRRQEERPPDVEPRHHELHGGAFVVGLGEVERVRHAGQVGIRAQRPLRDDLDLLLGEPLRARACARWSARRSRHPPRPTPSRG